MLLETNAFYHAEPKLNWLEQVKSNEYVVEQFNKIGFTEVRVSGLKGYRYVAGKWSGAAKEVELPKQVVKVNKL